MGEDVVAVLVKAKELVAAGWIQGEMANERGVCLVGAISRAMPCTIDLTVHQRLWEVISDAIGVPRLSIGGHAQWNDDEERTQFDVLDAFDAAIKLAKDSHA